MTAYFANKCRGCEHYDGFSSWDGSRTSVKCALGVSARISSGCSQFTPDESAECVRDCYHKYDGDTPTYNRCSQGFSRSRVNPNITRCSGYAHRSEDKEESSSKGGCFISTAACEMLNMSDSCAELNVLRNFRDHVLMTDPVLSQMVARYYEISPAIAHKIKNCPDCFELSQVLFNDYISAIVQMIREGKNEDAVNLYKEMVSYVSDKVSSY